MSPEGEEVPPWPGPRPYGEFDEGRFFGRLDEIREITGLVETQRLTVLSAPSGTGKTSLLLAGLIPGLRRARREQPGRLGFPLVLREWGRRSRQRPALALLGAVQEELSRLAAYRSAANPPGVPPSLNSDDVRDAARLRRVPPPPISGDGRFVDDEQSMLGAHLAELARLVGGLVLVIDQAEEFLGSGAHPRDFGRNEEIARLFALIHREPAIHVLLSLREDCESSLRPLGKYIEGGVEGRIYPVGRLPRQRVEDVISESLKRVSSVEMTESAVKQVLDWLTGGDRPGSEATLKARPVDLLRLQALLDDLVLHGRRSARGAIVDEDVVSAYRGERSATQVATHALENRIRRVTSAVPIDEGHPWRDGLARRAVARSGIWLSSPGGFKRPAEECELAYDVLREDFEVLRLRTGRHHMLTMLARLREGGEEGWQPEFDQEDSQDPRRSGAAMAMPPQDVARELALSTFLAFEHLERAHILKRSAAVDSDSGQSRTTCELVHDGFGPALIDYGDEQRRSADDALAALTSQRGRVLHWRVAYGGEPSEMRLVEGVVWLGCSLEQAEFKKVRFRRCNLKGTIFVNCRFDECVFEACELDGAVFRGVGGSLSAHHWVGGSARSVLLESILLDKVTIDSVNLVGSTLVDCRVCRAVDLRAVSLSFAQLYALRPTAGASVAFQQCDLRNALLEDLGNDRLVSIDPQSRKGAVRCLPEIELLGQSALNVPGV